MLETHCTYLSIQANEEHLSREEKYEEVTISVLLLIAHNGEKSKTDIQTILKTNDIPL